MDRVQLRCGDSRAEVSLFGGMTTAEFMLGDRMVAPLFQNSWGDVQGDPFLSHLRGDFFCLPFGIAPGQAVPGWGKGESSTETEYPHGYSANGRYRVVEQSENQVTIHLAYESDDLDFVERRVTLRTCGIDFEDTVFVRRPYQAPVGYHPIFRLPDRPGECVLIPPDCEEWLTYPIAVDDGSIFLPNASFKELCQTPLARGQTLDITSLPLSADTEELLCAINTSAGIFRLQYPKEGYTAALKWDQTMLPHCLIWLSNRGRKAEPWRGKNLCIGVEPVASAFDLGYRISTETNPMNSRGRPTYIAFDPAAPTKFLHSIEVSQLDLG